MHDNNSEEIIRNNYITSLVRLDDDGWLVFKDTVTESSDHIAFG